MPAGFLGQLPAEVNILEVVEEVGIGHPEDAIDLFVRDVVELGLGLFSPLSRVIGPFTVPLTRVVGSSVRVPQVEELLTLEVSNIENGISVTLNDTLFVGGSISELVLWRTGSHQGLDFVKIAKTGFKKLDIALEGLKSKLFRETILNEVS